ncbi:MAG TPA: chemotaxis protein CheB, partial [Bacteroidales bacterium]|nr:chemotaxis protein CheB [Bacteroidales bacterium]
MNFSLSDIEIIVIGGSAGSFNIVKRILASLPGDFPIPIVLCLHRLREVRSGFAESLNIDSKLHVKEVHDKE